MLKCYPIHLTGWHYLIHIWYYRLTENCYV